MSLSRSAFVLVAGRTAGFVASFAIPVVLARVFAPAEFGTYKQLFLIYTTLFGLMQIGMAESLYYFMPRQSEDAGRQIANAIVTLALAGGGCVAVLWIARRAVAGWMSNPQLEATLTPLAVFLALMLVSAVLEIVMVARKRHVQAALTYAASDVARTAVFVVPALLWGSLHAVLVGAIAFAAARVVMTVIAAWREFRGEFRVDRGVWTTQLAYALPFALAVGIEVIQVNYHQYVVAARFDAATFAVYAVGCLQIPLVDLIMTSTTNVMMVKMAEDMRDGRTEDALALWHDTICRLAFLMFPLAALLLVAAHDIIVTLFTARYAASVPIFMLWSLTILPAAFAVDAVLRVYAQTRFLLVMNLVRLGLVAGFIGVFMSAFGIGGAVLVTLAATVLVKVMGVLRIGRLMHARLLDMLPWQRLTGIALAAALAAAPAYFVRHAAALPPLFGAALASAIYGAVYLLLYYGYARWEQAAPIPRVANAPMRQLGEI